MAIMDNYAMLILLPFLISSLHLESLRYPNGNIIVIYVNPSSSCVSDIVAIERP